MTMYEAIIQGHEKAPFIRHVVTGAVALMPDAESTEDGAALLNDGRIPAYEWQML